MSRLRFLLHGIGGVYNYGCEAIVRGTVEILRVRWPDCEIIYLSRRPTEDRTALDDCALQVVDNSRLHGTDGRRLLRGCLRRVGLPYDWVSSEKFTAYRRTDCVISIGGDIFTLGPGPYPAGGDVPKLRVARYIMSKGCRFVLWGASVGPFDAWPRAVPAFTKFLRDTTLITVREPVTLRYLETLGIRENVAPVADPAFMMESTTVPGDFPYAQDATRLIVGVNLSPLSLRYASKERADGVRDQVNFLDALIRRLGVRLLLIPHVLAPHQRADDDYSYLQEIYVGLREQYPDAVRLLPPDLGARRTKGIIGRCDALLAARMHCAIAGVSNGIPTLFIAYSAKAKGMAQYVYEQQGWSVDLQLLHTVETMEKIQGILRDRSQTKVCLMSAQERFRRDAMKAGRVLADRVDGQGG
jgi:colanic acid/amylovoran biosynthesis protein